MAFDFGAALSSLGQIAPAMSEGAEIRRQRLADAARVSQQAQAAQDEHAARLAQIEREKQLTLLEAQNAKKMTPLGEPVYDARDRKYYRVFLTPDNQLKRLPIEGYDPEAEKAQNLQRANDLITKFGIDPKSEFAEQVRAQALGVKLPLSGIPRQVISPDGTVTVYDPRNPTGGAAPVLDAGGKPLIAKTPGTDTVSDYTDPLTGLTIHRHTVRRPLQPGQLGQSGNTSSPTPRILERGSSSTVPESKALDKDGNIPPRKGLNEYVRAAANDLLHGKNETQIEPKIRPLARALAQKYGWSQADFKPPLTNAQKNELEADAKIEDAAKSVLTRLEPLKDRKGFGQQAEDLARMRLAWTQYSNHMEPTDPVYGPLIKDVAYISVAGAGPWMTLGRNRYTFEKVQQHLPQPQDTPALLYDKVKWLTDSIVPSSQRIIGGLAQLPGERGGEANSQGSLKVGDSVQYRGRPAIILAINPDGTYQLDVK